MLFRKTDGPGVSGWTVDTLHDLMIAEIRFCERRINDIDMRHQQLYDVSQKAIDKALASAKEAVLKSEAAAERRFESINEFRGQLSDQASTFLPRNEHSVQFDAASERMGRLEEAVKAMQIWQGNVTGRLAVMAGVFAVFMTVVVFIANYLTSKG